MVRLNNTKHYFTNELAHQPTGAKAPFLQNKQAKKKEMIEIKYDIKGIKPYLLYTKDHIQKIFRRAVNSALTKVHNEGYKKVREEFDIDKKEYKLKRTTLKKIKIGELRKINPRSAKIQAETKGLNYIRFAQDKRTTALKGIKRKLRKPVFVTIKNKTQKADGAFIAKTKKNKLRVFRKKNKKMVDVKTDSVYSILTEESTQNELEKNASKQFYKIFNKDYGKP